MNDIPAKDIVSYSLGHIAGFGQNLGPADGSDLVQIQAGTSRFTLPGSDLASLYQAEHMDKGDPIEVITFKRNGTTSVRVRSKKLGRFYDIDNLQVY